MIRFEIPWLPPSSNNAWFNLPRGGRAPKPENKKFKAETQTLLVQQYANELKNFAKNEPYTVFFRIHVSDLENTTWGKKKGAEARYKKLDITNRIKLLEDVIADVTGIDDAHTMSFIIQKVQAALHEKVEVFIWNTLREESPFDEPLSRL